MSTRQLFHDSSSDCCKRLGVRTVESQTSGKLKIVGVILARLCRMLHGAWDPCKSLMNVGSYELEARYRGAVYATAMECYMRVPEVHYRAALTGIVGTYLYASVQICISIYLCLYSKRLYIILCIVIQ